MMTKDVYEAWKNGQMIFTNYSFNFPTETSPAWDRHMRYLVKRFNNDEFLKLKQVITYNNFKEVYENCF
jgi:hypothetical protein